MEIIELANKEAVKIFEYQKNNDKYCDRVKLHKQVVTKALLIAEAFYPRYLLLFFFDNAISHLIYTKDAFQARKMNKSIGGRQEQLQNGWFDKDNIQINQLISFQEEND